MLYILLIIIAIGVLLASESGKQFLNVLIILTLIAGGLYLAFWVVVIAIGVLSEKELRDNISAVLGGVLLTAYAIYGIHVLYKGFKKGDYTIKKLIPYVKIVATICLTLAILWIGAYFLAVGSF